MANNYKNDSLVLMCYGRETTSKGRYYKITVIRYIGSKMKCVTESNIIEREDVVKLLRLPNAIGLNLKLTSDNKVLISSLIKYSNNLREVVPFIAQKVRELMEKEYGTGTDLCGSCIEASELICALLKHCGVSNVKTVEGWCEFDDEFYGSDRPYDPHTWVEMSGNIYIDVTADQFNPGMDVESEFKPIIIQKGLPHGMTYTEPEYYED